MATAESIREAWERGRAGWPELAVDLERFHAQVGDVDAESSNTFNTPDTPDTIHAEDAYLAAACVAGVPQAIAIFRAKFHRLILDFVARIEGRSGTPTDLADEILVELLVGDPPTPAKLAGYSGRGPLRTWLRMIATRRALNAARDQVRHAEIDERLARETVRTSPDPEAALLKAQYGPQFEAALRESLAALPAASRALLRLHYGESLALGAIAAMNGWSKPTAGRRLAESRETLLVATRKLLRERLRMTASELESMLRLLRSDLDASLAGLLTESPA